MIGLEIIEPAVADALENARINEIVNASFYAGDARLALRELVEKEGKPDLAVIDPPRAGLSQKIVRRIVDAAPSRIVYVSCNPTTLAPNAAQLVEAGYRLIKVRPVDMFPQTPHIECVALFEAGPDGVKNPDREAGRRERDDAGGLGPAERRDLAERGRARDRPAWAGARRPRWSRPSRAAARRRATRPSRPAAPSASVAAARRRSGCGRALDGACIRV